MKNISSELEFGGKQSLETLENHQNGLLPFPGMGRPDLSAINGIGSLAKSKERLSSQSSAHFSSSETLNSCEQPLLPASPSYLSSSSPRDRRQPSDRCVWRGLRVGRSLRKCQNPCMSEWRNGGEASGMVRSASLLEIRHSPKFSHADVEFGPEPCPGQCGDDRWPESNANDSSTEASKACCHCATRRASSPTTAPRSDSANGPLSLSAVLESIPIAYNPRTKQLHIISVSPNQARQPNCGHESDGPDADRGHEDKLNEEVRKVSDPVGPKADPGLEHPRTGSLQRVSTCGSSISSISSLSTEFSASTASAFDEGAPIFDVDEAGFIEINLDRQSNRSERSLATHEGPLSEDECEATQGAKPKKRGLSGFLSRNLLPWKSSKEVSISDSAAAGWKLFGKAAPRHSNITDPNKVIEEYHARQRNQANPSTDGSTAPRSRKSEELIASSTTALILENRPSYLPAKNPEEEVKHRVQYEQMVEAAKKKELKEAKLKKKLLQQQLRHEEQLSHASKIWNSNILPCWDTLKNNRRTKDLWWQGIPPSVRGKVWKLAIGNNLHITPELYEICVCRAKDRIRMAAELISMSEDDFDESDSDKEGSVQLIKLDVSRTFPQLCIFQKGGPYYDMLHSLLGAYVCYRPDVGYVQGMSFLAAVLILNLDVADAFICFANLLNQPCQLAFFRLDEPMMRSYFLTYEEFFKENMPKLFNHFTRQNLSPDLYLIDWIYTVYSRSLPLDVASRVWDVFFRDGDEFLFRTALGILKLYEDILLNLDFIHLAQFLTKLPEDIAAEPLFKSIEYIRMITDKRNFAHVLLSHAESKQT